MKGEITIGLAVVAGAALFEAALVPGIILGGAAARPTAKPRGPRNAACLFRCRLVQSSRPH